MVLDNERIIIKTKSRPVLDTREEELSQDELFLSICQAIKEGGYNPTSQIVGYIVSEDPTHITNYKNARTLIGKLDRDELLKQIVESYIDKITNEIEAKK